MGLVLERSASSLRSQGLVFNTKTKVKKNQILIELIDKKYHMILHMGQGASKNIF